MDYPKIMRAGKWQEVVVANEEQERALPKEYGGLAGAEPQAEPTVEELQAQCEEQGIKYDKRWGVAKLLEALA